MTEASTVATPSWRRRHGATLIIVGAFLLAVVVAAFAGVGDNGRSARYDPDNPGPDGAQALARVLDQQGVDVSVVRSADELDDAAISPNTAVVVTSTEDLGERTLARLLHHVPGTLVLVDPRSDVASAVVDGTEAKPIRPGRGLSASCGDPMFDGLTLKVDSALVYDGGSGCFEQGNRSVEQELHGVTFFGAGEAMTNEQILRGDNAAVSLRLLGQSDHLIWYVPRLEDLGGDEGFNVGSLIPRWIDPGLWLVAIATIFLIVWRSRRLGPLSIEPLPVVVKAIETTRSRGRLYRKANDRSHAAAALRSAARDRAAHRLGLGVGHDLDGLIRDLARHVGRPEAEVAALLGNDADIPTSDRDLIKLARDLTELDKEVRKP